MKKLSGISSRAGTIGAAIAIVGVAGITGATAANTIGSSDIKDGSIKGQDVQNGSLKGADIANGSITLNDLKDSSEAALKGQKGDTGPAGPQGIPGPVGPASPGDTGLAGAYYSVAFYNAGDTNAGAIATVACKATTDVAISGGVQVLGLDADANSRNTPVSSSFPGRMDFGATPPAPRPNRLDGWIVQFGGTNEKPPLKTKIWALCVPGATIPVEQTFIQNPPPAG